MKFLKKMEISRQSRSRIDVRQEYENLLNELCNFGNDASTSKQREFIACQSGIEEVSNTSTKNAIENGQIFNVIIDIFTDLLTAVDNSIQLTRTKFFNIISFYGEDSHYSSEKEGGMFETMAEYLPQFYSLAEFINTSQTIAENLFLQIHGFHHFSRNEFPGYDEFPLTRIWRALGDILGTFIVLDELIASHPFLSDHWKMFIRTIQLAHQNPIQFNLENQFRCFNQLNSLLNQFENNIMKGNILKNFCHRLYSENLISDRNFMERFRRAISEMLNKWEQSCSEAAFPDTQRLLSILSLATLYHHLLPKNQQPDKKMIRQLSNTYKKVISFHLFGDLLFLPFEYLKKIPEAEKAIDRKTISNFAQLKKLQLDKQIFQLNSEIQLFENSKTKWEVEMAKLDEILTSPNGHQNEIINRCDLLLEGVQIVDRANRLLKCILNGHLAEERAISTAIACQIFQLIDIIKEISNTFNINWNTILEWNSRICTEYSSSILCILEANIQKMNSNKRQHPTLINALQSAEFALSKPTSRHSLIGAGISLELANYAKTLRESKSIDEIMQRIDIFCNFGSVLMRITDLSFLYWHRISLMETFCAQLKDNEQFNIYKTKNFFIALNDSIRFFQNEEHFTNGNFINAFSDELFVIFKKNFIEKICSEIENDLRITYHSQQSANFEKMDLLLCKQEKGNQQNSDANVEPAVSPKILQLIQIPKIKLGNRIIDVKGMIVSYLESTFYNLSVIALHDAETYRRMQILANIRYGLFLTDPELPCRSVDQGLDAITIMKNLDKFVDNYCYDFDEQFFIERQSQGKNLNIVRVQQIVNSMKTNGIGLLNPLINFSYKFLRSQFQCLSHYLFNEKTTLIKEIQFYRDSINQSSQSYSMDQAKKMANYFQRSGRSTDFLEKFRLLIVRIGNTLGLVRMFRAGIVENCSPNILLNYHQKEPMTELLSKSNNQILIECAKLCDRISQNIWSYLRESDDCIELLTSVFIKEFRNNEKYGHLRNFFIIVPILTLVHVEHILKNRSKLESKRMEDENIVIVDDGFCMGIAYILTLLNQQFFFNSLNWFESVFNTYRNELEEYIREQKIAQKSKDESLLRILAVKMNQTKERTTEFRKLMCSMNSALTFFQANELCEEDLDEIYFEDF